MSEPIALRPEVLAFAQLMEMRLRAHDADKGESYKSMLMPDLCVQVVSKSFRLEDAIRCGFYDQIPRHAADAANYCMMIDAVAGSLERSPGATS